MVETDKTGLTKELTSNGFEDELIQLKKGEGNKERNNYVQGWTDRKIIKLNSLSRVRDVQMLTNY